MANVGTKQWLGNQEALSGDYHVFAMAGNTVGRQPLNGGNGNGYDDGGASYTLTKTDVHAVAFHSQASSSQSMNPSEVCPTLDKSKMAAVAFGVGEKPDVAHCLRSGASKADKHESTTYIAQPKALAFKMRGGCEGGGKGYLGSDETAFKLSTTQDQQIAFYENHPADSRVTEMGEVCTTVTSRWGTGGGNVPYAQMQMQVRRLTPTECARLQGFPDDYLRQVPSASDSAIYKALGNSMAVNVMQLLGERIAMVDAIPHMKAVA